MISGFLRKTGDINTVRFRDLTQGRHSQVGVTAFVGPARLPGVGRDDLGDTDSFPTAATSGSTSMMSPGFKGFL